VIETVRKRSVILILYIRRKSERNVSGNFLNENIQKIQSLNVTLATSSTSTIENIRLSSKYMIVNTLVIQYLKLFHLTIKIKRKKKLNKVSQKNLILEVKKILKQNFRLIYNEEKLIKNSIAEI
jgi:hypothetical protein